MNSKLCEGRVPQLFLRSWDARSQSAMLWTVPDAEMYLDVKKSRCSDSGARLCVTSPSYRKGAYSWDLTPLAPFRVVAGLLKHEYVHQ